VRVARKFRFAFAALVAMGCAGCNMPLGPSDRGAPVEVLQAGDAPSLIGGELWIPDVAASRRAGALLPGYRPASAAIFLGGNP
jgi:hypothetical protein